MRRLAVFLAVPVIVCLALAACSAAEGPVDLAADPADTPPAADVADVPETPTLDVPDVPDFPDVPACPPALAFADPFDDQGLPSDQVEQFTVYASWLADRDLKVVVTACGEPAADVAVVYEVQEGSAGTCTLAPSTAYSDADGLASVVVKAPEESGECLVRACVAGSGNACRTFRVDYSGCTLKYPLAVDFDAGDVAPQVDTAKVYVFQVAANGKPSCADLDPRALPTATAVSQSVSVLGTAFFKTMPGLDEAHPTQKVTVVALGSHGTGPTLAWGCNDTDGNLEIGATAIVTVVLHPLPPVLTGTWALESTFDLLTGLPDPLAPAVHAGLGILSDPAGTTMALACGPDLSAVPRLQAFCAALSSDPAFQGAVYAHLLANAAALRGCASAADCAFPSAGAVQAVFRDVRLRSTMTCEAVAGGAPACRETWDVVSIDPWGVLACPQDACTPYGFSLGSVPGQGEAPEADLGIVLGSAGGVPTLEIAPHDVRLKYRALVRFLVERALMPGVFGAAGAPPMDAYDVLLRALAGTRECLAPGDCCDRFAAAVAGSGPLAEADVAGACDEWTTLGADRLVDAGIPTDADPESFALGTPVDVPCPLIDTNGDLLPDRLGSSLLPCTWEAAWSWGTPTLRPAATFTGSRNLL